MAQFMNTQFDPGKVLFGGGGSSPYLPIGNQGGSDTSMSPLPLQVPKTNFLNAEAVRATGSGPYDPAYRQNLATYAGGQFTRPGGVLAFNPTDPTTFPGQPTGGGTAPIPGLPPSLISQALGGEAFGTPQPTQDQQNSNSASSTGMMNWQDWLKRFRGQGRMFGLE